MQPTIVNALCAHVQHPEARYKGFHFIENDAVDNNFLSLGSLYEKAAAFAPSLTAYRGKPLVLIFSDAQDFIQALFACWFAGAIAVPLPVPQRSGQLNHLLQMAGQDHICDVLTTTTVLQRLQKKFPIVHDSNINWIEWRPSDFAAPGMHPHLPSPGDIALIQYTSGSTSSPKGIIITHGNVAANCRIIQHAFLLTSDDCSACWVPHYHDMGLIDGLLMPVYAGFSSVNIPASLFIRKPAVWMQAIHLFNCTYAGGPNFALEWCIKKISDEEVAAFRALRLRILYNAAEPVQWATLKRFSEKFGHIGYAMPVHVPGYGLAEATLAVSFSRSSGLPGYYAADPEQLKAHKLAPLAAGVKIVCCGTPGQDTLVQIADEKGEFLAEGNIGEIYIHSPSVAAKGYWNNPGATRSAFIVDSSGGSEKLWLKSGDLGFMIENELFITGRRKDLIKHHGYNIYPQDLELTAAQVVENGYAIRSAAFQLDFPHQAKIVLVQESGSSESGISYSSIIAAISRAIFDEHGLALHDILLVRKGQLPVTTSGKLKRYAAKELYIDNCFVPLCSLLQIKSLHASEN